MEEEWEVIGNCEGETELRSDKLAIAGVQQDVSSARKLQLIQKI